MDYIQNEQGDYKVIDQKGNIKFFSPNLIKDSRLLKKMGFELVQKPLVYEPQVTTQVESNDVVAESAPAKRGRPSKI